MNSPLTHNSVQVVTDFLSATFVCACSSPACANEVSASKCAAYSVNTSNNTLVFINSAFSVLPMMRSFF